MCLAVRPGEPVISPEMTGRIWRDLLQSHSENPIRLMKSQQWNRLPAVLLAACLSLASANAQVLTTFKQCNLIAAEWSDGDSFQIQTPEGQRHTIRLYGADCFEWHVTDETDARRLREQRRYFGLSEWGGSPLTSIQAAKELGEAAAKELGAVLKKPFQVHSRRKDCSRLRFTRSEHLPNQIWYGCFCWKLDS